MAAPVNNLNDNAADAIVARDPGRNTTLRTTCIATMVEASHATNALLQRAKANVNCRILPGNEPEQREGDQLEKDRRRPGHQDHPGPPTPTRSACRPRSRPRDHVLATKVDSQIWPACCSSRPC